MKAWGVIFLLLISFNTRAGESDLYDFLWLDPDKSVYVLQNKIYPKDKSLYLDMSYGIGLTDTFQDTNGTQLKLGYYFHEEWAFEFDYISYTHSDNSAFDSIKVVNSADPFIRRFIDHTSLFAIWSPFYGKINTFNKIYYFDWSFGAGFGYVNAESNIKRVVDPGRNSTYERENYTTINLKTNVKFHINKRLHLGLEFFNANYMGDSPKNPGENKLKQNNDIFFSIGVSF